MNPLSQSTDSSAFHQALLTIILTVNNVLYALCTASPNVALETRKEGRVNDSILGFVVRYDLYKIMEIVKNVAQVVHIAYTIVIVTTYPEPPSIVCPSSGFSQYATPTVFTWNWALASTLLISILAGCLRIEAFRNLGASFTFTLREPEGLVTHGVHRYMQHPSYTGLVIIQLALFWILVRFDGIAACWIPADWLPFLIGFQNYVLALASAVFLGATSFRVMEEEQMLKRVFGKEWAEYHSKTARFIPGIF